MLKNIFISATLLCVFILVGCNPNCEPISGLRLSYNLNPVGYDIAIYATPLSQLDGKNIYFGSVKAQKVEMMSGYLKVTVPDGVPVGNTLLKIEDPDCQDVVQLDFTVADPNVFKNNINFVTPVLPQIILPTLPSTYPSSIDKAWLGPINGDYCLWFAMDSIVVNGKKVPKKTIDEKNSFEFSTCKNLSAIYHVNPVYGIYDTATMPRTIHIWIDRRSKTNGFIEEYTGTFQNMEATPYNVASLVAPCATLMPSKNMIVLTSLKTGRQLVVAQPK
jgi:hypothetical protein